MKIAIAFRSAIAAAACAVVIVRPAAAQSETPEQVVGQMMAAMQAGDWDRAAGLMHPVALRQLHDIIAPVLTFEGADGDSVRQQIFGFATLAAATAASDSAVFVSIMRFAMAQQPGVAELLRSSQYQPLGTVLEGRDTVHVVGRMSMRLNGRPVSQLDVTSVMRSGTTWRGLLKGDWSSLAEMLREALGRAHGLDR